MKRNRLIYYIATVFCFLLPNQQAQSQAAFGEGSSYRSGPSKVTASNGNTNIATGTIAPTIPLLTLPGVSGNIALSLQYTAGSGIKVNEVASEIGLGWSLAGGGAIVRDVKGLPDDGQYGWFTNAGLEQLFQLTSLPNAGYLHTAGSLVARFKNDPVSYNNINILSWLYSASQMASYGQYTGGSNSNTYVSNAPHTIANNPYARYAGAFFTDNEPDVYTLSLPTGKLQFVFDPLGNPVLLQAQNIKIEPLPLGLNGRIYAKPTTQDNAYGFLQEFRVTTSDGVKYYFGSPYNPGSNFDCKEYLAVV
jgi:hypothetical protein